VGHVFARLFGYGLILVPMWPYRFDRSAAAPSAVTVTHWDGGVQRVATVRGPAHDLVVELSEAGSVDQVVDVLPGPEQDSWRIETSLYSVAWPEGFSVESPGQDSGPSKFDLHGPDGALIYVQGPFARDRLPPAEQLAAAGQEIVKERRERDVDVVELAYEHDGEDWRQGYWFVPFSDGQSLVVTAQAPAGRAAATIQAGDGVALSVRRR
jgi:hypothetical protein